MNRNLITFSANEQTLIKTGGIDNYASNTVSYIVAEFDLGENWDEFDSIRAVFQSDYATVPAVLAHGSCLVPFEVLRRRSTVRVNLVGSVVENDVLIDRLTTFPITALNVTANALVDNSIAPISPSEFEQFVAMVKDDADRAEAGAESAEDSAEAALASAQAAAASALSASNSASNASEDAERVAQMVAEVIAEIEEFEGVTVTVETLPAGSQATASFANGVLHLGIPKGDKGDKGDKGGKGDTGATGATGATGNGIASITLTSTSGAVKTYTILFTDGTSTTFDVTDGEVTQAVLDEAVSDLKAEITQNGVVAGSQGLVSDAKISDSVPYLFRQTADGTRVGNVVYEEIVGGTVAFNQQVHSFETSYWTIDSEATGTLSGASCSFTASAQNNGVTLKSSYKPAILSGRKYLFTFDIKATSATTNIRARFGGGAWDANVNPTTSWVTYSTIKSSNNDLINGGYYIIDRKTEGWVQIDAQNVMVFDLTAMFGTTIADHLYSLEQATAGAGIAVFRKMFPNSYYPYNAGELKSVEGLTSHDMTGKNQFPTGLTWTSGTRDDNGTHSASSISRYSSNIKALPSTTYTISGAYVVGVSFRIYYLREDGSWISRTGAVSNNDYTFTTPSDCHYIQLQCGVVIDISNVQIEYGSTATAYKPYQKRTYPLDSTFTMRGIPKLSDGKIYYDGDVYASDGTVTRKYGIVDLGSLAWQKGTDFTPNYFLATVSGKKAGINMICPMYVTRQSTGLADNTDNMIIAGSASTGNIYVVNTSYTDATAFKTAMSGVYLVYEKATPTTENAEPYTSPQIVDRYGTEEYVTTGIVPIGHNSKYSEDLKGKVESLPWDFSTLIAPTETGKATQNYTVGSYLIMNNTLYKVTSAIANGGTITPNTNCIATTIMAEIMAL